MALPKIPSRTVDINLYLPDLTQRKLIPSFNFGTKADGNVSIECYAQHTDVTINRYVPYRTGAKNEPPPAPSVEICMTQDVFGRSVQQIRIQFGPTVIH